ncbi:Transketolase chloroplastic, partial [Dissostichus eleginoides]
MKVSHTHRRVTFSTTNPVQDLQDASQHSYYDSGLEESETPSSKSSSGPRIGPLTLPEDHYERTTPDGSIGETEHPENGTLDMSHLGPVTGPLLFLGHRFDWQSRHVLSNPDNNHSSGDR